MRNVRNNISVYLYYNLFESNLWGECTMDSVLYNAYAAVRDMALQFQHHEQHQQ